MALSSLALITTINVQAFPRKSEIIDSWSYLVVLKSFTGLCPINSVLLKNLWLIGFGLIIFLFVFLFSNQSWKFSAFFARFQQANFHS